MRFFRTSGLVLARGNLNLDRSDAVHRYLPTYLWWQPLQVGEIKGIEITPSECRNKGTFPHSEAKSPWCCALHAALVQIPRILASTVSPKICKTYCCGVDSACGTVEREVGLRD